MRDDLTAETLRQILHYNPDTGVFTWIRKPRYAGSGEQAGSYSTKGYRRVKIGVTSYRAHRLAWFYMTGQWPVDQIDHINGIPDDNRFSNLREATAQENQTNKGVRRKRKASKYPGVSKSGTHWISTIRTPAGRLYLGFFADEKKASEAYLEAKRIHHPFWASNERSALCP